MQCFLKISILAACFSACLTINAVAKEPLTPEECVLDTLKGATNPNPALPSFVLKQCIRNYLAWVEPVSSYLPIDKFLNSELRLRDPLYQELSDYDGPLFALDLRNNGDYEVTSAMIEIEDKTSGTKEYFRLSIDTKVIGRFSIGQLKGRAPVVDKNTYWNTRIWRLHSVIGLAATLPK